MPDLRITTIQSSLYWESPEENCNRFTGLIAPVKDTTDLVVLPEMFTTGFSMDSERLAEPHEGPSWQWMVNTSSKFNVAITGSLIIEDKGNFYNRLYFVKPDGTSEYYDKRHLFRMADENQFFSPGNNRLVVEYKGWKICPLICYDLRFPVWSRNTPNDQNPSFDLLIYVANWPMPRANAWSALLTARAIENQCYVVGVNRVGEDGNKIPYSGNTAVIDPKGITISTTEPVEQKVETSTIEMEPLARFRKVFPVGLDADSFQII